jgi:hypothetical protein
VRGDHQLPYEAELLPAELALGALGMELATAEDLEHLSNVKQVTVLGQCW